MLREKARQRGFIVAANQGRNLHGVNPYFEGPHHDYFFRDFETKSRSPDVRAVDQLIDQLVAEGRVDRKRIYVMGWSNGATFAQLYAIARHTRSTPGGNRIAAAAVFAGFDPFNNLDGSPVPSCRLASYPKSTVPILLVARACDSLVACNAGQQLKFGLPPGDDVEGWMQTLRTRVGNPNAELIRLNAFGEEVGFCTPAWLCTAQVGFANHIHWPDGVGDSALRMSQPPGSAIDDENAIRLCSRRSEGVVHPGAARINRALRSGPEGPAR